MNSGLVGWSTPAPPAVIPYVNVQDQKAQNTPGGTFTTGAWQTRALNTIQSDSAGIATLASSQITLPAGTYRCRISCPAALVNSHQTRLQNITDGTTLLTGTSEFIAAAGGAQSRSFVSGRIRLTGSTVLEVQHRCQTTSSSTQGFGVPANLTTEVYTVAEFFKES